MKFSFRCEKNRSSYFNGYLEGRPAKDTAFALVQWTVPAFRFIERFNLVKPDGKWLLMDRLSYRQPI